MTPQPTPRDAYAGLAPLGTIERPLMITEHGNVYRDGVVLRITWPSTSTVSQPELMQGLRRVIGKALALDTFDLALERLDDGYRVTVRHERIFWGRRPRGSRAGEQQRARARWIGPLVPEPR